MATTSLWHIEGRLKDLIAYVENPEKTRADTPNLQPLWDIFSYVSRPEATEQGEYVSAVNCLKEYRNCESTVADRIAQARSVCFQDCSTVRIAVKNCITA